MPAPHSPTRIPSAPRPSLIHTVTATLLLVALLTGCGSGGGGGTGASSLGAPAAVSALPHSPSGTATSDAALNVGPIAPGTTPPDTAPLPSQPTAAAHSRLGINLAAPADWSTELPFVDCFRLSRPWISQREGAGWGQGPPLSLDAHGYPRSLQPGCYAETLLLTFPGSHRPQGSYVCLYDGSGTVEIANVTRIVSQAPGRIVVELKPDAGPSLRIRDTLPADPVRNIRFLMPGTESTHASQPFTPAFLQRWSGFHTYRFMDWMGTNGSAQRTWAERPTLADATWAEKGVPVEVIIDLCNLQGVHPWICIPHQADDLYVRSLAALFRDRLNPSLKVWVEYSNEVWNGGFPQHAYAEQQARLRGLGPSDRPWEGAAMYHGQRSSEIFALFEQEMGTRQRMVAVVAWQAANAWTTENLVLPSLSAAQPADVLAIAPYLTFLPSPGGAPEANDVATWSIDRLMSVIETHVFDEAVSWMAQNKAVADARKLRLVCYEAGQHLVGIAGAEGNDALTARLTAANRSPRMGALYTRYMDAWQAIGGDTMCLFTSCGEWSGYGSWGLTEFADETVADQPKLDAVLRWNREHLRP